MRNPSYPVYYGKRNFIGLKDIVISLYTQKCQFNCSFCSIPTRSSESPVRYQDINKQIDYVLEEYSQELESFEQLSIGNEGSILDRRRFPEEALEHLLKRVRGLSHLKILSLETRPEYIREEDLNKVLENISDMLLDVTCGFETQNDYIRNKILRKNIDRKRFEDKVALIGRKGMRLTSYVLLKPDPEMSEEEGIQEAIATIQYLKEVCAVSQVKLVVYLNPTYVAINSPLEKEMRQRGYTPPNYQSIFQVISESQQFVVPIYVGLWNEGLTANINSSQGKEINAMRRSLKVFNGTQNYAHLTQLFKEEKTCDIEALEKAS